MRESQVQKEIMDVLNLYDAAIFRMNAGQVKKNYRGAPKGTPDLFAILPDGRSFWIEVKRPGEDAKAHQEVFHHMLRKRKQNVIVADNVGTVIKAIREGE